jgi:ketosteroid isomerase-like protein
MKNLLSILLLSSILFACNTSKKGANNSEIEQKNIAVAKQLYVYFNKHDWKNMAALYTPTAEFLDPSFGTEPVKQTREQIEKKYAELQKIFPDINDQIINIYASGDQHVIVEFISTGTAPDSSKLKIPICNIFQIENGVITKDRTYYNNPK